MSEKGGRIQNLTLPMSTEEARKRGKAGAKKSAEVRQRKKLLSQIYGDMLGKKFEVTGIDGKKSAMDPQDFFAAVVQSVLMRGDTATVAMLKEIRESTEKGDGDAEIMEKLSAVMKAFRGER